MCIYIAAPNLCVILKTIAGAHLGQRFRLEASSDEVDNSFKIGRSTGKAFKEKGVSLYKDKEISTTHAKVCIYALVYYCISLKSFSMCL